MLQVHNSLKYVYMCIGCVWCTDGEKEESYEVLINGKNQRIKELVEWEIKQNQRDRCYYDITGMLICNANEKPLQTCFCVQSTFSI